MYKNATQLKPQHRLGSSSHAQIKTFCPGYLSEFKYFLMHSLILHFFTAQTFRIHNK